MKKKLLLVVLTMLGVGSTFMLGCDIKPRVQETANTQQEIQEEPTDIGHGTTEAVDDLPTPVDQIEE